MSRDGFLFDPRPPAKKDPSFSVRPKHDGPSLTAKDQRRLGTLMDRVATLVADSKWRTLAEIAQAAKGSEASVSARLRDLRKEKFQAIYGKSRVDRRRRSEGVWEYRVVR